jgi:hypothetical protein
MPADFHTLKNYYEHLVIDAVILAAPTYPLLTEDHHPDVACVALNRLPPRYIRHQVDFAFYLTESERLEMNVAIRDAVSYAFNFVRARSALRSRG